MVYDDVLRKYVGEIGRYQYLVILALNVCIIPGSIDTMEMVFTQATPLFWPIGQNYSSRQNASQGDPCEFQLEINGTIQTQQYTKWEYDESVFESTLVTQFNLVCQQAWVLSLASTVYFVSFMAAFPIGICSDRFGRKPCLVVSHVLNVLFRILQVWSPSATIYVIARFFVGFSHVGRYATAYVLATELVGPSRRLMVGVIPAFSWTLGCFVAEGYAFAFRSRFYFELASTISMAVTLPLLWFIPESPRWLSSKGRYKESIQILEKMAAVNGRDFPSSSDETLLQNLGPQSQIREKDSTKCCRLQKVLSSHIMVLRTLIMAYTWLTITLSYYVLTLNTGKLAGDIYLNTFLTTLVEIPGVSLVLVTLTKASGRSVSLGTANILTGLLLLTSVPLSAGAATTTLSLLGKLCITYAFTVIYIYTCELYPTTIRHLGFGLCSLTARIGSSVVPVIISSFPNHVGGAILIGTLSFAAGILVLFLPETRATTLPQTITEAEAMDSFLLSRCRSKDSDSPDEETPDEDASVLDVAA